MMPPRQWFTFQLLLGACCDDLWAMQQLRQENPDLQLCVLDAMCLGELHLPAAVADMKLHQLAHLAFDADPGYGTVRTSGDTSGKERDRVPPPPT